MKQAPISTDDLAIANAKPGDVVHVRARIVDVHDDGLVVDVIGTRARYRVHPSKLLIAAIEPHVDGEADIIERLCGAHGRVVADDLMRARRAEPRAVAG